MVNDVKNLVCSRGHRTLSISAVPEDWLPKDLTGAWVSYIFVWIHCDTFFYNSQIYLVSGKGAFQRQGDQPHILYVNCCKCHCTKTGAPSSGRCVGAHITSFEHNPVTLGPQMHAAIFAAKIADAEAQQSHTARIELFANSCFWTRGVIF
jgi:hypothetical protein